MTKINPKQAQHGDWIVDKDKYGFGLILEVLLSNHRGFVALWFWNDSRITTTSYPSRSDTFWSKQ